MKEELNMSTQPSDFPATGHVYLIDFNVIKFELDFTVESKLTYTLLSEDGTRGASETVSIETSEIRPGVHLVTWKEASGTTVVHIEDFENASIITNITAADGTFTKLKGTLSELK